jgi:hypothetical protein
MKIADLELILEKSGYTDVNFNSRVHDMDEPDLMILSEGVTEGCSNGESTTLDLTPDRKNGIL